MNLGWSIVESIDTAAAFRAFGIRVMSDKSHDLAKGKDWHRWSVCRGGPAESLIHAVRQGQLEKIDPGHPILDSLAVLKIRHQLCDAMHTGQAYRIDLTASIAAGGAVLVKGHEPTIVQQPPHVETGDIKISSCLIRLGLPIARITGTPPLARIILASPGYPIAPARAVKGELVVQAFRQLPRRCWAQLEPDLDGLKIPASVSRLRSMMHALWIRDELHNYINGRTANLIITRADTKRQLLMPEDASNDVLDRARKWMGVP